MTDRLSSRQAPTSGWLKIGSDRRGDWYLPADLARLLLDLDQTDRRETRGNGEPQETASVEMIRPGPDGRPRTTRTPVPRDAIRLVPRAPRVS
jgi:hypothetical protein